MTTVAASDAGASGVPVPPAAPGRALDSTRDPVIHEAALALVCELGYDRTTMDAIAARARASKATLYRRWSSKAELVVEAIKARGASHPELPDTGEIREDLLAGLRLMVAHIEKDDLGLMSGLVNAMRGDPELAAVIQNRVMADKREAAREWTQRAIDRGQLPASADTELFNDVAPAMVFMRLMMCGLPVDEPFLARIVDDVLLPLLTRAT